MPAFRSQQEATSNRGNNEDDEDNREAEGDRKEEDEDEEDEDDKTEDNKTEEEEENKEEENEEEDEGETEDNKTEDDWVPGEEEAERRDTNPHPKASDNSTNHLIELLFGLSLALYTEPLVDGQPSSTILVYFSGILAFSITSQQILPARVYTSHLSALIYMQRLLFLEQALPLQSYPTLGIKHHPRTRQLDCEGF
ncbi:hypothetical protein EDB80DRAFT_826222 [Ilyonectria destructans]|nr:hypothetical protein EDB80DRAFT_826222 [Ilyonectria destructans]